MADRVYDRDRYERGYDEEERYGSGPEYWRYGRGYDYDRGPYYRGYGSGFNEPFYRGYGYGSYSNEPYRSRYYGGHYNEPYERGHGTERWSNDPYFRRQSDRGFWERAGDELRAWFGDEEAARRRRIDEMRSRSHEGRGPRGYKRSDERIREDVNDRLTDDYYLDASDIEVVVKDCVVTLTGRVDSRSDKRRAEDLAESVSGVTDVSNQLRVGHSAPTTTGTEAVGVSRGKA